MKQYNETIFPLMSGNLLRPPLGFGGNKFWKRNIDFGGRYRVTSSIFKNKKKEREKKRKETGKKVITK